MYPGSRKPALRANATGKRETLEQTGNKQKLNIICLADSKYVHTAQDGSIEKTLRKPNDQM